jgi:hypothetical protein
VKRHDGLNVQNELQVVVDPVTLLPVELEGNADEVGDRVGELLGQLRGILCRGGLLSLGRLCPQKRGGE